MTTIIKRLGRIVVIVTIVLLTFMCAVDTPASAQDKPVASAAPTTAPVLAPVLSDADRARLAILQRDLTRLQSIANEVISQRDAKTRELNDVITTLQKDGWAIDADTLQYAKQPAPPTAPPPTPPAQPPVPPPATRPVP